MLGFILNPVEVHGARAFLDFAVGGYIVAEEVFPSRNYAEFSIQHWPVYVDELRAISAAAGRGSRGSEPLRRVLGFRSAIPLLVEDLLFQEAVEAELVNRGVEFPTGPDHAIEILDAASTNVVKSWFRWVFGGVHDDLERLARRRFAHLDAAPG